MAQNGEAPRENLPSNAVTPLPVPFRPRRKRIHHSQRHLLKRRRTSTSKTTDNLCETVADVAEDAAMAAMASMSDTHVAILTLRSQWPGEATNSLPCTPPIILRSQIYALVADATAVDSALPQLARDRIIRPIEIPATKNYIRRDAYVLSEDFKLQEPHDGPTFQSFFSNVFAQSPYSHVKKSVFCSVYGDRVEDAITELIRTGFLTLTSVDEDTYAFTVPGMAEFVEHRALGAGQITTLLKKAPYREMPLSELELRSLKNSYFTAQWHVRDVVGLGIVRTVETSIGIIARLPLRR